MLDVVAVRTERFGHSEWRLGQREVIERVLEGRPTLAVMPTGSGKSLCYQLPAVLLADQGLTIVVSPLIALIRDQVQALRKKGIQAASYTSADSTQERRQTAEAIRQCRLNLLFVAPERFRSPAFVEHLRAMPIALFAVDEAHCISVWGHDFRPDYARLGIVQDELRPKRRLALTATATPEVQRDITRALDLGTDDPIVTGFDRPNLELTVRDTRGAAKKIEALDAELSRWLATKPGRRGSAIVYASTRRRTEEVAEALQGDGYKALAYHAGLTPEVRARTEASFRNSDTDVVVATTAFGMGIDKPDVRVVVHYDIPGSPESYYQEIGRAGRDGDRSGAVLLYDPGDLRLAFVRLERSCPTPEAVESTFFALMRRAEDGRIFGGFDEIAEVVEGIVGPSARASMIDLLRSGSVSEGPEGISICRERPEINEEALRGRARHERQKLDAMISFVNRAPCRRRYLVDYFGDRNRPERCGICDRCRSGPTAPVDAELALDVRKVLSCVARMRGRWGRGRVIEVLLGSKGEELTRRGLDQLSTYGLLASWTKTDLGTLFDALVRADLVSSTRDEYPKVFVTPLGVQVMKGETPVEVDYRRTGTTRRPRKEVRGELR